MKINLPTRVADYFLIIGVNNNISLLNNNTISSSSSINSGGNNNIENSVRRTHSFTLCKQKLSILQRYPYKDHEDADFPKDVSIFCMPKGIINNIDSTINNNNIPTKKLFTFILTEGNGARVYCSCLLFYEENKFKDHINNSNINSDISDVDHLLPQDNNEVITYTPKCLIITSHWPFYTQFEQFLNKIFSICNNNETLSYPIESIISNFIYEVPLPPPGRLDVEVNVLNESIIFKRPPPNQLPNCDIGYSLLFQLLSADNIATLIAALLAERRILFVSSKIEHLTPIAELCGALIFPFFWQHIFIPVLPKVLIDYVCAPMPFIMGVEESYLPDELLLEGVILVNLDKNEVKLIGDSDTEMLQSLPERELTKLMKDLKKIVENSAIPIKSNQTINDSKAKKYVLGLFIRLFKNYHKYLEPPSSSVTDKFLKAKYLNDNNLKNNAFMNQLVSSQLFQCFVDERMDESAHENLNVLFFDEALEADAGKPTPFLSDTSQNHNPKYRVVTVSVSRETADTDVYKYSQWPELIESRFPSIRLAPVLINKDDNKVQAKSNISKLSMQFFNEKRKFSHHFHALRVRSNKQDLAFKDISFYLKAQQDYDEKSSTIFDKSVVPAAKLDTIETATSIDNCWALWRHFIIDAHNSEVKLNKLFTEQVAVPLIATHRVTENELKILFFESRKIDEEVSNGKQVIEAAKAVSKAANQKCSEIRTSVLGRLNPSGANSKQTIGALSSYDINRVVSAQSEVNEAKLLKLDAESFFRSLLANYETRMPQISEDTRNLNCTRIAKFKESMLTYVSAYEKRIEQMQKDMAELKMSVEQIDVDKDMESFSEGSKFVDEEIPRRKASTAMPRTLVPLNKDLKRDRLSLPEFKFETTDEPIIEITKNPATKKITFASTTNPVVEERLIALRSRKSFAIELWSGFAFVTASAEKQRKSLKESILSIENWSEILDNTSKYILKSIKNFVSNVSSASNLNADRLEPNSFITGLTFLKLINSILDRFRVQGLGFAEISDCMKQNASLLRVLKGELKNSIQLLQSQRLKLTSELEAEILNVTNAKEKRDSLAEQKFYHRSSVESNNQVIHAEKSDLDFNRAVHEYSEAQRKLGSMQKKHDVCLSRYLDLFERNEAKRESEIQKAFVNISTLFLEVGNRCQTALYKVKECLDKLDVDADLREFIQSTYTSSTPDNRRVHASESVVFSKHVPVFSLELVSKYTNRSSAIAGSLVEFITEIIVLSESEQKAIRRQNWTNSATNTNVSTPLQPGIAKLESSLNVAFERFKASIEFLGMSNFRDRLIESLRCLSLDMEKQSQRSKEFVIHSEKMYQDSVSNAESVASVLNAAANAATKAAQASMAAQQKVNSAEAEINDKTANKSGFLSLFATPIDTLKERLISAINEAKDRLKDKETATAQLAEARSLRQSLLDQLLNKYQTTEISRYSTFKNSFTTFFNVEQVYFENWIVVLSRLREASCSIDVSNDIQNFIKMYDMKAPVPSSVREEHERRLQNIIDNELHDSEKMDVSRYPRSSVLMIDNHRYTMDSNISPLRSPKNDKVIIKTTRASIGSTDDNCTLDSYALARRSSYLIESLLSESNDVLSFVHAHSFNGNSASPFSPVPVNVDFSDTSSLKSELDIKLFVPVETSTRDGVGEAKYRPSAVVSSAELIGSYKMSSSSLNSNLTLNQVPEVAIDENSIFHSVPSAHVVDLQSILPMRIKDEEVNIVSNDIKLENVPILARLSDPQILEARKLSSHEIIFFDASIKRENASVLTRLSAALSNPNNMATIEIKRGSICPPTRDQPNRELFTPDLSSFSGPVTFSTPDEFRTPSIHSNRSSLRLNKVDNLSPNPIVTTPFKFPHPPPSTPPPFTLLSFIPPPPSTPPPPIIFQQPTAIVSSLDLNRNGRSVSTISKKSSDRSGNLILSGRSTSKSVASTGGSDRSVAAPPLPPRQSIKKDKDKTNL